jgi:hypothetical protein
MEREARVMRPSFSFYMPPVFTQLMADETLNGVEALRLGATERK